MILPKHYATEFLVKSPTKLKIGNMQILGFLVRIEHMDKKQIKILNTHFKENEG